MTGTRPWGFYGRSAEQDVLQSILDRRRWFFAKISGRRRIGKTTLIHRALQASGREQVFYVQVPDSGPSGVLSAVADAMDTFRLGDTRPRPTSLQQLSALIAQLVREGIVVVLDEFQYFHRKHLHEFCSFLQREVDALSATAHEVLQNSLDARRRDSGARRRVPVASRNPVQKAGPGILARPPRLPACRVPMGILSENSWNSPLRDDPVRGARAPGAAIVRSG